LHGVSFRPTCFGARPRTPGQVPVQLKVELKAERVAMAFRLLSAYAFARPESEQYSSHPQIDCDRGRRQIKLATIEAGGVLLLDPLLCFTSGTPIWAHRGKPLACPKSCPKNGDVPNSPFPQIGSTDAVGRHNKYSEHRLTLVCAGAAGTRIPHVRAMSACVLNFSHSQRKTP